jgi:hypothetical protein
MRVSWNKLLYLRLWASGLGQLQNFQIDMIIIAYSTAIPGLHLHVPSNPREQWLELITFLPSMDRSPLVVATLILIAAFMFFCGDMAEFLDTR